MNTQKGFVSILIILLGIGIIGGGVYVYTKNNNTSIFNKEEILATTTLSTTTAEVNSTPDSNSPNTEEELLKQMNSFKGEINASAGKEIISKIATSTDSNGKVYPSAIVDPKNITEAMFERYDKTAYIQNLLNLQISTMLGSFEIDTIEYKNKKGSYVGVCDDSKKILTSYAGVNRDTDDELSIEMYKQTGITIDSYRINESVCKSNESSFVLNMPIPLKDGTNGTVCLSNRIGSAHPVIIGGKADFNNLTCVK